MAKKKKASRERPLYSQRFLTTYGRKLQPKEIRLVQGYRGLSPLQQEGLLALVSDLIIQKVQAAR